MPDINDWEWVQSSWLKVKAEVNYKTALNLIHGVWLTSSWKKQVFSKDTVFVKPFWRSRVFYHAVRLGEFSKNFNQVTSEFKQEQIGEIIFENSLTKTNYFCAAGQIEGNWSGRPR